MTFSGLDPFLILSCAILLINNLVLADKIRGTPGVDYPNYFVIPQTSFRCSEQRYNGFYADPETRCQVFHYCYEHRQESFLCPMGTIFSQPLLTCDYWYSANCSEASSFYHVNAGNGNVRDDEPYKVVSQEEPEILFDKMASLYRSGDSLETGHQEKTVAEGGSAEHGQASNEIPLSPHSSTADILERGAANSTSNVSQASNPVFSEYTEQLEHAEDLVLASDGTLQSGYQNSNDESLLSGSLFDYSYETDEQPLNSAPFSEENEEFEFEDPFQTASEESEYDLLRRSSGGFVRKVRKRRPIHSSVDATPEQSVANKDENQINAFDVDSSESHHLPPEKPASSLS